MKKSALLFPIVVLFLASWACSAPGLDKAAEITNIAAEIYATQTAAAPEAMATSTLEATATPIPAATNTLQPTPTSEPTRSLAEQFLGRQCTTNYVKMITSNGETTLYEYNRVETVIEAIDEHTLLIEVAYLNASDNAERQGSWRYNRDLITGEATNSSGSKNVEKEVLVSANDTEAQFSLSSTTTIDDWIFDWNGEVTRDPDTYLVRSFDASAEVYDSDGNYWGSYHDGMTLISCTSQPAVTVNADGSGDYATLPEALEAVSPGATIHLSAGDFRLQAALVIDKPISIIGMGPAQTKINGNPSENNLIWFEGPGVFSLKGVALKYTGTTWSNVLVVNNVEDMYIQNCHVSGAVIAEDGETGGAGIVLFGETEGGLASSEIFDNDSAGILVRDNAYVFSSDNFIHHNGKSGIALIENTEGSIRYTHIASNASHGITLQDQSEAEIKNNQIYENTKAGILFTGASSGVVMENDIYENAWGVYIEVGTSPEFANNKIHDNTGENIYDLR